ncbi:TlpA family protein disulfide reductase [Photobacterium sp. SDRW27]|uniref:TlpA family protein disulfide reductase n=1 Tax=Photobacterium obscurum TaxID=2829490 RepID=UPI002243936F|nr:TlpA disulfide reductase family protein [Photobacterium obscurum]MCW8328383.1 TlpA family protein disulfide reductase [Photobacterium obscurum]
MRKIQSFWWLKFGLVVAVLLPQLAFGRQDGCPVPAEFLPVAPFELPVEVKDRIGTSAPVELVNFWAIWCRPCLKELPLLDQLSGHPRFDISAIHVGDNKREIKAIFKRLKISNLSTTHISDFEPVRALGFAGIPSTLVAVNQQVRYQAMGYIATPKTDLEQWLICLSEEFGNEVY